MQSKPDSHQNLKLSEKIGKKNMKKKKKKKKKKKEEAWNARTLHSKSLTNKFATVFHFNQKKKKISLFI